MTMHELSVALSLIDVINETLIREQGVRATRVTVELGQLSGVVPEALRTAFHSATRNTDLAPCELVLVDVPVSGWCNQCKSERPAASPSDHACAACGTAMPTLLRGKEMDVVELEMDTDDDDDDPNANPADADARDDDASARRADDAPPAHP
jgi:hydrogenase nickel incorporation protein HypA/HybF